MQQLQRLMGQIEELERENAEVRELLQAASVSLLAALGRWEPRGAPEQGNS